MHIRAGHEGGMLFCNRLYWLFPSMTSNWPIGVVVITLPSHVYMSLGSGREFNPHMSHSFLRLLPCASSLQQT